MRFGITVKLFLAILVTCIVVAIAMGVATRLSFQMGFEDYVQEREARRAQLLGEVLEDVYRETGSWQGLRDNPRRWTRILRSAPDGVTPREPGGQPVPPHARGTLPPFYLTDAAGNPVVGAPAPEERGETPRFAIESDGRLIGWLVMLPRNRAPNGLDERFLAQQLKATWVISGLSVLLAALVSILLARTLLAPVRRLGRATHRLAAGEYATRVPVTSRDELGQLAQDFNRLALTLENNERLRRDLVADISHELRTPLAILRGELEALQDGVRTLTPDSLASLQAEVATLNKLIDDLHELALADIGGLHYRMTQVDVAGLLQVASGSFRERLGAKRIEVELALPERAPAIQGDPQRLTQLFNNLLENTVRYTDPDGRLRISVTHDERALTLRFEDSAPGVPPEVLPRLFERLFRAESSRNRESGGSGLGLAICQRIVEAHGGTIVAEPSPLGGVAIAITFPLYRS